MSQYYIKCQFFINTSFTIIAIKNYLYLQYEKRIILNGEPTKHVNIYTS